MHSFGSRAGNQNEFRPIGVKEKRQFMSDDHIIENRETPAWQLPAIVVLGLIALGGLWFGWNASSKLDATQQSVAAQLKTTQQAVQQDVSSLKDRLAQDEKANTDLQGDLSVVTKKLKITQGQLKTARAEAAKLNDETTQKLTALDTSVKGELATKASSDDLKNVDSRLGEREYVEFTIAGKNKPQKVGNLTVELKGVNQKRNQYSVVMVVEDKRFEKKNRALNEPVFFYTSGTRLPEEMVINKVSKDQVSGYVSIPKANTQQTAAATATSGR